MDFGNDLGGAKPATQRPLLPLCDHVSLVLKDYLAKLDSDEVGNLYEMVITEVERPLIQTVLEQCGHNQSKAAQMLGLSRSTLRKKIATLNLQ